MCSAQYGYRNMRVPIVEPTPLFVRGIGDATDIVEKEMYTFEDKLNGESLTLRPEATAGIVRAAIEHNLTYERPQRVWTAGPMFRHERPQKGRYRQFHQFDVEALGFAGPDVDAEQIVDARAAVDGARARRHRAARQFDRRRRTSASRIATSSSRYFEHHAGELDDDSRRRLHTNPLRILDSKNPALQEMIAGAPKLVDRLGDDIARAFRRACSACSTTPASRTRSIRGSCAASTITIAPCSSGSPTASARRAPSPAAAATTACSSSSAASRRRPAASRSASSG